MGADLILAHWWTTKPEAIDFDKAHKAIEAITIDEIDEDDWAIEFDDSDEAEALALVQERAHADLDEMIPIWEGMLPRDVNLCDLGPVTALISGGMTWGDDPTETFTLMNRIPESALRAAGFFE